MSKYFSILLALACSAAMAQTQTQSHQRSGYVTKDGTYVAPSRATNPNDTKTDNYSSKGNVNPYTGKAGTVDPYKPEPPKAPKPLKF